MLSEIGRSPAKSGDLEALEDPLDMCEENRRLKRNRDTHIQP